MTANGPRVFAPEIQAFPLRSILEEAITTTDEQSVVAIVRSYGIEVGELYDKSAWVSLEFMESLLAKLIDSTGDPGFLARAMSRAMSPAGIGPLYPLLVAFGSPAFTYRRLPGLAARINKTGRWDLIDSHVGFARLSWSPYNNAARESGRHVCAGRMHQLILVPTLFGIAPAEIGHTECMLDGGERCVYDIRWRDPPARRDGIVGLVLGGVAGVAVAASDEVSPWIAGCLVVAFALAGTLFGRLRTARAELRSRVDDVVVHGRALESVTLANEQRFSQLLEAKAEVEQRVDERTAELRATSRQLAATIEKVQALDRAKTDFFNNVSHELRSPLTLILGPLREIVDGREPPGGREQALKTMARNADRLLRLINQILDLAKIDAGDAHVEHREIEPAGLIENVVADFETAARRNNVTLDADVSHAPTRVLWDSAWMESAIGNLVANALRHVDAGGHVHVRLIDKGASIILEVEDNGSGIAPQDLPRVFDRFAQAGDSHAGKGGTGLGLAIVREAARLHGGDATVESVPGERTVFRLTLPRVYGVAAATDLPASNREVHNRPEPVSRTGEVEPGSPDRVEDSWRDGPAPQAPLALVVEDNADLRVYMADILCSRYRVKTARDGEQALEMAAVGGFEVIVSDVAMPRMDGYELCRRLRALETTRAVPIILVTAAGHLSRVLDGFAAGADDYVTKPFHARELLARVDVHARLRAMTRQVAQRERLATLGTVAASVAHQVRNPLTALVSGLPAMRRRLGDKLDEPSIEMFDTMLDCSERIQRITNDLLDLSRMDRAEVATFRPGEGLASAVRLVATRLESHEVSVDIEIDSDTELRGRPGDMNQVFMNLLDNAARAVAGAGVIRVRAEVALGMYVVRVEDSGAGVPQSDRDLVFEPFWTSRPPGQGTGLGLSLARTVVEQHAGRIELGTSSLGGACFTVRLPLNRSSQANDPAQFAVSGS